MRLFLLLLVLIPLRTWTDSTGKHKAEAELADFKGGTVYLLRGGQIKSVPIARLSADDQKYVRAAFPSQEIVGEIVGLADGDTLTLLDATKTQYKIRLEGIDAPESHQDFGTQSRKALGKKVIRKTVRVEWNDKDKYGRTLGHVFLDGRWINQEQVSEGLAWHYKQYNNSAVLAEAESKAREAKLGLWAQSIPIAPWDFRHPPTQTRGPPLNTDIAGSLASDLAQQAAHSESDETVYLTETGTRYHRAGCKYLDNSSIPISLSEAQGLYSPCKICHPELIVPRRESDKVAETRVKRPRRSYNTYRKPVQIGPSIPAPYALGGGGGGGGGGGPVHVRGYTRRDGTYVRPHTRSAPSR